MVKENIETVIDRLLDYINRVKQAPLADAAAAVGRPANHVERLALLLEEKELLEVHYNIGGVRLVAKKPEEPEVKKAEEEKEGAAGEAIGKSLEREVMTSESLMNFFEKDLERRMGNADRLLTELEDKQELTKEEIAAVSSEVELAIRQLEAFGKEIQQLSQREEQFKQKLAEFKRKLAQMKPTVKALQAQAPPKTVQETLARILRQIIEFLKFVKEDLGRLVSSKPGQKPVQQPLAKAEQQKQGPGQETPAERQLLPPLAVPRQDEKTEGKLAEAVESLASIAKNLAGKKTEAREEAPLKPIAKKPARR